MFENDQLHLLKAALDGVIPPTIATSSKEGIPNVTYISKIYWISENELAISHQFFNKTWKNLNENPYLTLVVTNPTTGNQWKITAKYKEQQQEGDIYEQMAMELACIAQMYGMENVFNLKSSLICSIIKIDTIT